jgi:hypothetical protein
MNSTEKKAVEEHLLKASGLGEKSRGYKAIQHLFRVNELDVYLFHRDLVFDIRKGCMTLGLECDIRWDKIILDESAIRKYYEEVMGLTPEKEEDEIGYFQRRTQAKGNS